ncbi:MAG: helix-turn-helix transcriptional regulator [Erysipelotrichaceae bacterium]|nr:helix-turn-helix transcriptional regulator [Erysipelotrichaceae bacterium]MCR4633375.1 helix-turn-helix transcriptional regulator [Erysipelotrichaceae bacterium]
MISYKPLWKTMKEKNVSQYQLLQAGIGNRVLDSLRNGKNINMLTLEKLCEIIGCTPNDIVEFIPEEKK